LLRSTAQTPCDVTICRLPPYLPSGESSRVHYDMRSHRTERSLELRCGSMAKTPRAKLQSLCCETVRGQARPSGACSPPVPLAHRSHPLQLRNASHKHIRRSSRAPVHVPYNNRLRSPIRTSLPAPPLLRFAKRTHYTQLDKLSLTFARSTATSNPTPVAESVFALSFTAPTVLRVVAAPLHATPAILQSVRGAWPRGVKSERKLGNGSWEFRLKGFGCTFSPIPIIPAPIQTSRFLSSSLPLRV
jgi:hypothetical protein